MIQNSHARQLQTYKHTKDLTDIADPKRRTPMNKAILFLLILLAHSSNCFQKVYSNNNGTWSWSRYTRASILSTSTSYTLTGLAAGKLHNIRVRAVKAVGGGSSAGAISDTPRADTHDAITDLSTSTGSATGEVDLSWTAPDDGGEPITHYEYGYGRKTNGRWSWVYCISTSSMSTSHTVTGLDSGVLYRFRVMAKNSVTGRNKWSRYAQARAK